MTRKRRRLLRLGIALLGLGAATALILTALDDTLTFFHSPSEVAEGQVFTDRPFRLGGMVAMDSIQRSGDGVEVTFTVTDYAHGVPVVYAGILPDLFREGQGVVTEGRMRPDGVFEATEVLARHDENYMPAEIADALDAAGTDWRENAARTLETP